MREVTDEGRTAEDLKEECANQKRAALKTRREQIDSGVPQNAMPFVAQARDTCASSWLNALPIQEQGFVLNKDEFCDALRLRYNLALQNLPSKCVCGDSFNVSHALTCKRGGFVSQRHDNIRDLLTVLLSKICKDVESEPHLTPLTNERMDHRTANTDDESRLDIKARGFWRRGQTAFFDVRVTHVNSPSQKNQATPKIFRAHEQAKKREYMQRVLDVEHGSFTQLVFGTNGGLGKECDQFLVALAEKLSRKCDEKYSQTCLLYTSPSPRDRSLSRMPSSA